MDHWLRWRCYIDVRPAPGTSGSPAVRTSSRWRDMIKRSKGSASSSPLSLYIFGKCCVSGAALNRTQGRGSGWSGLRWVSEISPGLYHKRPDRQVPPNPDQSIGQDKSAVRQGWAADYSGLIGKDAFSPLEISRNADQVHSSRFVLVMMSRLIKMFAEIGWLIKNRNTHQAVPTMVVGLWETDIKML